MHETTQLKVPLNCFESRYTIRHPIIEDVPALVRLEQECWPEALRAHSDVIWQRIEGFPSGQCVLLIDGQIVGVIYSQRIQDVSILKKTNCQEVASFHVADGPIIQLLAVNVLPAIQHLGFGDQLLEFMLLFSAVRSGVERVVAVSLCKNYADHAGVPIQEYIRMRNEQGCLLDPILRFHEHHGAAIVEEISGYRPKDADNRGYGILVEYDIHNREPRHFLSAGPLESSSKENGSGDNKSLSTIIKESVCFVLGKGRTAPFSWKRSLMDMGLDSLDLFGLRALLSQRLSTELDPTFFFQYSTPKAIANYFKAQTQEVEPQEKPFAPLTSSIQHPVTCTQHPAPNTQHAPVRCEPLAIIGMACRFPRGANSIQEFWSRLHDGVDAISEVPPTRWDINRFYDPDQEKPGKISTRYGGFLDQADRFDARFFNISPREAKSIDPQHRILLELNWAALEHAGIDPESLAETQTGVFVGLFSHDYEILRIRQNNYNDYDTYFGTGSAHCLAAGRLAYVFGFQGPAVSIDTACSSSLVAVHLACQSLRNHECDLALASGVNLLLAPELSISFSRAGMLSRSGRCKTFDASADGYVRSDGGGVVVLKRLSQAVEDRDHILAVIRGTAINQDGSSNGMTAPNGLAQEAVIRKALSDADLSPADISYVEAHGTGTSLGDPVEFKALQAVFGKDRAKDHPLVMGSVKTNIGHTEAAAGIAGLIKTVLSMEHGHIPKHLHFENLNPLMDLDAIPAMIPRKALAWQPQPPGKLRRAGVSSFGFSGTNAHVVVEEFGNVDSGELESGTGRPVHLLTLSAKTEKALTELAGQYERHLTHHKELAPADICFTANRGRTHFAHRLCVTGDSTAELCEKLGAFNKDCRAEETLREPGQDRPRVAFLFTGQGSQYIHMGRELYRTEPIFKEALHRCDDILRPHLETPLLQVLYPHELQPGTKNPLDHTAYTQPALFSLEYALAELWKSWGIAPDVVMGHSVGEYVAACVAGVFSLEQGLKLIAGRARLMQALPRNGKMQAVFAREAELASAIAPYGNTVSIAAFNGLQSIVVSGLAQSMEEVMAHLEEKGVRSIPLNVSHAFHSPLMEPMLEDFRRLAEEVTFSSPQTALISNVTGLPAGDECACPQYWVNHVRQPVRFQQSMETLTRQGYRTFLEIGPKPVLLGMGRRVIEDAPLDHPSKIDHRDATITYLPSLVQGRSEWRQMLQSLGELYVQGASINWPEFERRDGRRKVVLPTYPFQGQRYWIDPSPPEAHTVPFSFRPKEMGGHPLLGIRIHSAVKEILFESRFSLDSPSFLKDHSIFGKAIFPAAAYLEMALAAGQQVFKDEALGIKDLSIHKAIALNENEIRHVQTVLSPHNEGGYSLQMFTREENHEASDPSWDLLTSAKMTPGGKALEPARVDLAELRARLNKEASLKAYYKEYQDRNIDFGPSLRAVQALWRGESEILGRILRPEALSEDKTRAQDYLLHPILLDACLQVAGATLFESLDDHTYVLVGIESFDLYRPCRSNLWGHASLRPRDAQGLQLPTIDLHVYDETGSVVAQATGVLFSRAEPESLLAADRADHPWQEWLYQVAWHPCASQRGRLLPEHLPSPKEVKARLTNKAPGPELKAPRPHILDRMEALSLDYVLEAFRKMGWTFQPNQHFSTSQMMTGLGVVQGHRKLMGRLLEVLAEEGILRLKDDGWETLSAPEIRDAQKQWGLMSEQYPEAEIELTVLGRCGSHLAEVLKGSCNPLDLLFPQADITTATTLYDNSPAFGPANRLMGHAVRAVLDHLPDGRGMKVLEIGSGTGGTTAHLLPHLPVDTTQYVFTDVSPLFTTKAQERFRDYPFVQYAPLDIEQDPSTQGFTPHAYDLVLAANVLHATTDLRRTLAHVHQLLAPDGMLMLVEGTAPRRWLDLIFGLIEGWWKFTDHDLRPSYPLLSTSGWKELLKKSGFKDAGALSSDHDPGSALFQQAVIMARADERGKEKGLPESEHWLILADTFGTGQRLAALLEERGALCTLAFAGRAYAQSGEREFTIDPTRPDDFRRLLTASSGLNHVVHLWSLDTVPSEAMTTDDLKAASILGCGSTLYLIQALVSLQLHEPPLLQIVTRGAQPVKTETPEERSKGDALPPAQATLWGLGRVIALEHPEFGCRMIDLDPLDETDVHLLLDELRPQTAAEEQSLALRRGKRYAAHLVPSPKVQARSMALESHASYLITGGLGGTGLQVARWMTDRGAKHLVLVGRTGPSDEAQEALKALEASGVKTLVARADVAKADQLAGLFRQVKASMPPLRGIVHTAGTFHDSLIVDHQWDSFVSVFAPKVTGAWNLHCLTQDLDIDFFVLFSSVMVMLPTPGLSNYVAANGFLDALAHYRRGIGLPALSIGWGPWAGVGMAKAVGTRRQAQWAAHGIDTLPPKQALGALESMIQKEMTQAAVVSVDWPKFMEQFSAGAHPSFFHALSKAYGLSKANQKGFVEELKRIPADQRRIFLLDHVHSLAAGVMGFGPSEPLNREQGFFQQGMDSLTSVELRSRLQNSLACALPSTLIFRHPTVDSLVDYLATQVLSHYIPLPSDEAPVQEPHGGSDISLGIKAMSEDNVQASIGAELAELENMLMRS
ncbi:MAG: SDR family NAD(P)-dependent oxidoreductase [Thermodesulfobacteriota bacterium]|nr:SDR family NAD(P)-dependent oxidoreductase [Thermodesulfobacteriota bacterium]